MLLKIAETIPTQRRQCCRVSEPWSLDGLIARVMIGRRRARSARPTAEGHLWFLLLQRLVALASPLVESLLQIGCGGTATTRHRHLLAALNLRGFPAARLHSYAARRRADLTGGHATNAIDVASGQPLISPPTTLRTKPRAAKGTTPAPTLRGAWTGVRGRECNAIFCVANVRVGSIVCITALQHCCPLHPS
jgi:hypothetical protein